MTIRAWSRRRMLGVTLAGGAGAAADLTGAARALAAARPQEDDGGFGGLPMGIHGASLAALPNRDAVALVADDLGLRYLELTAAQVRVQTSSGGGGAARPVATESEVQDLRRLLESFEVTPTAFGPIRLGTDPEANRDVLDGLQRLGVRNVTCIPEPVALDHLEELAGERGLRLAIHNNAPGAPYDRIADVAAAVDGRGDHVGACLDVGNALRGSEDPADAVRRLGSRLIGVHLKDVSSRDAESEVIVIGEGFLDVPSFFAAIADVGFPADGAFSLEYLERPDAPLPGLREGLRVAAAAIVVDR